ncbi:hypothetical protein QYE76_001151 [Lolium multiflorum]|uniref:Uncharacterized protein n=1 Tax=Lolium multiflorum TaxID=4521 RepID=A0AAD8VZF1_LOLMU|nr:hypothetical protein QYE76_001151 [Lolium multiflorum]
MARLLRRAVELGEVVAVFYGSWRCYWRRQRGRAVARLVALLPCPSRPRRTRVGFSGDGGYGSWPRACLVAVRVRRCSTLGEVVQGVLEVARQRVSRARLRRLLATSLAWRGHHWARVFRRLSSSSSTRACSSMSSRMEPNEPINTKFYQLGNGGSLIFEHDLNAVSDFLGRPHPEFHGVQLDDTPGGELQWVITADLRGKMEPPTSERILFSFRESNWLDGLARGLQEALARLCGQNVVRILASRYAHLVRRDAAGVPMELQPHPELRHHAEHLDFMLYQTQRDLDATRAYANQTHAHITEQGEAIKLLNNDRKSLRQQRAKKDATIRRLRTRIASLEATVKAQEDQIRQLEDDDGGIDIQGGDAFLSDDDDFEEDENTEEEDYEFLEAGPDDYVPIDIDDEE